MQPSLAPVPPLGPEALKCTGHHVLGISGGKDSVCLAVALQEKHPEINWQYVITPTGNELPKMQEHWRNLEKVLGKPLLFLESPTLIETIEKHNALPNFRMRFCTRDIKIEPFMDYMDTLPEDSVLYVGLRADEEDRTGIEVIEEDTYRVAFPFQWWGWNLDNVIEFLDCRGIVIPERTDCAWCFYQRLDEWHSLYMNDRPLYNQGAALEMIRGYTFRSDGRDTWPASLVELAKEFEKGRIPKKRTPKSKSTACPWCAK